MITIHMIKEFLYYFSWIMIPCIMTAFFLFLFIIICIAFKRLANTPEITRDTKKAYQVFKEMLIKDLGGLKR